VQERFDQFQLHDQEAAGADHPVDAHVKVIAMSDLRDRSECTSGSRQRRGTRYDRIGTAAYSPCTR
jgi:hypothetical protein